MGLGVPGVGVGLAGVGITIGAAEDGAGGFSRWLSAKPRWITNNPTPTKIAEIAKSIIMLGGAPSTTSRLLFVLCFSDLRFIQGVNTQA